MDTSKVGDCKRLPQNLHLDAFEMGGRCMKDRFIGLALSGFQGAIMVLGLSRINASIVLFLSTPAIHPVWLETGYDWNWSLLLFDATFDFALQIAWVDIFNVPKVFYCQLSDDCALPAVLFNNFSSVYATGQLVLASYFVNLRVIWNSNSDCSSACHQVLFLSGMVAMILLRTLHRPWDRWLVLWCAPPLSLSLPPSLALLCAELRAAVQLICALSSLWCL